MSAVLKADPNMGTGVAVQEQWMLSTLTSLELVGALILFLESAARELGSLMGKTFPPGKIKPI